MLIIKSNRITNPKFMMKIDSLHTFKTICRKQQEHNENKKFVVINTQQIKKKNINECD